MAGDSDVEKIKDRLSIVDVVGQYVTLKKAGRTYMARCPFHKERTPSFHVSPERGTYKCFGCGEGGDIFTFVEKMEGVDFPTALKQLAEKAGVTLMRDFSKTAEHKEHDERLREVSDTAAAFFETELKKRKDIIDYLHSRGVKDETITLWRLGYAPADWRALSDHLVAKNFSKKDILDTGLTIKSEKKPGDPMTSSSEINMYDRFRGRIMFPIFDSVGRVVAFSGRFFEHMKGTREESEPAKYVNSPETALFKKGRVLYGFDRAKGAIRKADCILLVEGQFDMILSHQSGLPFTVALSGTALTPEHLSLLSRLSKRLVLALDADEAGVRSGLRSAEMALGAGFDVKVPTFPEGKDPADLARENPELLKAAIRTSRTAVEFFLDALRPSAKDERGYQKLVEAQVLPLIAAIESKIEQEHFIRIVASRLGVSETAVRAEVGKKPISQSVYTSTDETESRTIEQELERTPLERAVGMLLSCFTAGDSIYSELQELLGEKRLQDIEKGIKGQEERLRFEFDALGEDRAVVTERLIENIEHKLLLEKIAVVQSSLRQGAEAEQSKLLLELSNLKRREQELRK